MSEIYCHYKGGRYELIANALHSETKEPMVVYRSLDTGTVWVRPGEMFYGGIEMDGRTLRRFVREEQ